MSTHPTKEIDPKDIAYVEIFPPVGIARLGDSGFNLATGEPIAGHDPEFFLPSEIPGVHEIPAELNGLFRDSHHGIKRQAVRFRVYAYNKKNEVLGELNNSNKYKLDWTVDVANAKGSFTEFRGQHKPPTSNLRNPEVQPDLHFDKRSNLIVSCKQSVSRDFTGDARPPRVELRGKFRGSRAEAVDVYLGELRTDTEGHLIFLAGPGYSRCVSNPSEPHFQPDIISEFDSVDWVDDVCDGWVDVSVTYDPENKEEAKPLNDLRAVHKATVLSGPPKIAWGINSPTTLYDIIEDIYHREIGWSDHDGVQFYQDIWPVLYGSYTLSWANEKAFQGHGPFGKGNFLPLEQKLNEPGPDKSDMSDKPNTELDKDEIAQKERWFLREHIFGRLRKPNYQDATQASTKFMPRLSGNDGDALEPGQALRPGEPIKRFASLTPLQCSRFQKWRDGNFKNDPYPKLPEEKCDHKKSIECFKPRDQPALLTRAALEHTVGDPLYPGMEMGWSAKVPKMYSLDWNNPVNPPIRIDHDSVKPGHITRSLSLPWQSDFSLCNTHWWPSARPDDVYIKSDWDDSIGKDKAAVSVEELSEFANGHKRKWDRALRPTPDYPSEFYPGSTDMVRHWQKLGFIRKLEDRYIENEHLEKGLPIWIEQERQEVKHKRDDMMLIL